MKALSKLMRCATASASDYRVRLSIAGLERTLADHNA